MHIEKGSHNTDHKFKYVIPVFPFHFPSPGVDRHGKYTAFCMSYRLFIFLSQVLTRSVQFSLLYTFQQHKKAINILSVSPDGRYLLSGGKSIPQRHYGFPYGSHQPMMPPSSCGIWNWVTRSKEFRALSMARYHLQLGWTSHDNTPFVLVVRMAPFTSIVS